MKFYWEVQSLIFDFSELKYWLVNFLLWWYELSYLRWSFLKDYLWILIKVKSYLNLNPTINFCVGQAFQFLFLQCFNLSYESFLAKFLSNFNLMSRRTRRKSFSDQVHYFHQYLPFKNFQYISKKLIVIGWITKSALQWNTKFN